MAKQLVSQRKIYKLHSSRFRHNKFELNLNDSNTSKEEVVSLSDSQAFEFVRIINGINTENQELEVVEIKKSIKILKHKKPIDKSAIKKQIDKLNNVLFVKDLCFVVMDSEKDYYLLNKKMKINGVNFKRLLATTGGVKSSTIIYASEKVHDKLSKLIENGRNMDIPFSAGKLEAYKSLVFSGSNKVSNPTKFVVVKDYKTCFKEDIIELDDSESKYPIMKNIIGAEIDNNASDGFGIMLPSLSKRYAEELGLDYLPSGFLIRNSFLKGMCFTMDYVKFAGEIANNFEITDAWGDSHNIVEESIDMIITESMLKLYDSYKSCDHYMKCCDDNGYSFRVAKVTPKTLENQRNLNYQFIQPLDLSDDDIQDLIKPTVDYIKDSIGGDIMKSILFTKGFDLSEDNLKIGKSDFAKAMMVEPEMVNDPFVRAKIHDMMKKKIKDAKMGVLRINGNFQIASGDTYGFMEHVFGVKNPKGLLKAGEVYSNYWSSRDVDKISCFRAPMSCHNNIRNMEVAKNSEMLEWYKYMDNCIILNSWDTMPQALNGLDYDADAIFTTNSEPVVKNVKSLPTVICKQKPSSKIVCGFDDFVKANINGFGDEIGSITNKITSMFGIIDKFEKDSEEYKELEYRILCGQLYQQNAIDKIKAIIAKPMPTEWYQFRDNITKNENGDIIEKNQLNIDILADKKPYFFIHNYSGLNREYSKFVKDINTKCINKFGMTYDDLSGLEEKNEDMVEFLKYCNKNKPVEEFPSIMNKVCYATEKEFHGIRFNNNSDFDYSILKTPNIVYTEKLRKQVENIYIEYSKDVQEFLKKQRYNHIDLDPIAQRESFRQSFIDKCSVICDDETLCNIVLDMCYNSHHSKQFAWDIAGEQIIRNLLRRNNNEVKYPFRCDSGEIEFCGELFTKKIIKVEDSFANNY